MPAPWTCGPYRGVGVSSRARVSRGDSATIGLTASRTSRAATWSAFLPAAATVVQQGRNSPPRPAARVQLVTALRPGARTAPRNRRTSLGADRRSRTAARRENQWHEVVTRCEDVMAGSVRGDWLVW